MKKEEYILPKHVAIIMDGNGRWATNRGLSRSEGHKAGYETMKKLSDYIFKRGIQTLSIFAFSTENFKRSKTEVDYLMNLFTKAFEEEFNFYVDRNIKVVFSGRKDPLSKKVQKAMTTITEKTKNNSGGTLNLCINYGGHFEIIDACKKINCDIRDGKCTLDDINEDTFSNYLYQNLEPIDFVIRTSGEIRISNFMLYQMAYAELYFPKIYFPDFHAEEFEKALAIYQNRNRRFGGA